ncbi:hypothetical protein [Plantactinospora endophytica]|uniref:Alanine and proline-rich secreted protein Apa n=1 Tax=Plantactinospora endophytica TaxID=673535 RepID=A0ABQ4EAG6_9ACTN|nr:hypothetical protein [Plantactinospora endophytica]GIG91717.1 hypothetical protein Pen02_66530 [Plantactinospora endophytica]
MSHRTILEEAVGEIPPTTIDIDRLIAGQRRRVRLQRVGTTAAAVAAVATVTVGAVAVVGRPPADLPAQPGPTAAPVRTPVPSAGNPFQPVDWAIFAVVARVAPDLEWAPHVAVGPDEPPIWLSGPMLRGDIPHGHMGQGGVRSGDRVGRLLVQIDRTQTIRPCTPDAVRDRNCIDSTGPAGEQIRSESVRGPIVRVPRQTYPPGETLRPVPTSDPSVAYATTRWVQVQRPDGTYLIVTVRGDGEDPPLTIEQLTAIALDPTVTTP